MLSPMSITALITDPRGTPVTVEHLDEDSQALLFERDSLDEEWAEELEIWLETAEEEEADDDLVLVGFHPIGEDTQVERLIYYRKSSGDSGPIFTLDVDGTAVPGTLAQWKDSSAAFTK